MPEAISFQVYSLDAVFKQIEPYLKEGFSFDFVTNKGYPMQIGTVFTFDLLKHNLDVKPTEIAVEQPEDSSGLGTQVQTNVSTPEKPKTRRALSKLTDSN